VLLNLKLERGLLFHKPSMYLYINSNLTIDL
jgi:hypothetical protein